MRENIKSYKDLRVFNEAFNLALEVHKLTKSFPSEEKFSLTDQIRRSSRSVCLNLGEAWRKRRYEASFINKLNDAESEAAETQDWIYFAVECGYIDKLPARRLFSEYEQILAMLVAMINHADKWVFPETPTAVRKKRLA